MGQEQSICWVRVMSVPPPRATELRRARLSSGLAVTAVLNVRPGNDAVRRSTGTKGRPDMRGCACCRGAEDTVRGRRNLQCLIAYVVGEHIIFDFLVAPPVHGVILSLSHQSFACVSSVREVHKSHGVAWRKGSDSNSRGSGPPASFQDWCLKPLGHPSTIGLFQYTDFIGKSSMKRRRLSCECVGYRVKTQRFLAAA